MRFYRRILSSKNPLEKVWKMIGRYKIDERNQEQMTFTSRRYHLAFTGYAIALASQKTPIYPEFAKKSLEELIRLILDYDTW